MCFETKEKRIKAWYKSQFLRTSFCFLPPAPHAYTVLPLPGDHHFSTVTCQNLNNDYVLVCCAWFLSWKKLCHCFLASSLLGTSFGADCGQSEPVFPDAAAIGQKPSVSSLTSDQNPRAVLPALVGKHMGTERGWTVFSCDFSPCKEGFITCRHKVGLSFDAFHGIDLNKLHLSQM